MIWSILCETRKHKLMVWSIICKIRKHELTIEISGYKLHKKWKSSFHKRKEDFLCQKNGIY